MSGVSIGWFDPVALYPDPVALVREIKRALRPRLRRTRTWPLAVSSIRMSGRGTGVAYALIGGHIPLHIDQIGLDDSDGRIFQFVIEVGNRPALLTAPEMADTTPIYMGFAPPTEKQAFLMGGLELKPEMAVHFDITKHWHGITSLPVPSDTLQDDLTPRAVIVQVAGFAADEIGPAVEHAATYLAADLGLPK